MKSKEGGADGPGKDMTRGEFLKVGGAAAVVGPAGLDRRGPRGEELAKCSESIPQSACSPTCDPDGPVTWAIPAGVLNALWTDVFPRVVAEAWANPGTWANTGTFASQNFMYFLSDGDQVANFRTRLALLAGTGSTQFQARWTAVDQYLQQPSLRIPIRFLPQGGYDFLLSDHGLDVFAPKRPDKLKKLLYYYTIRRTGRRAIGTPFYAADNVAATSTDSPTGPGQVILRPEVRVQMVLEAAANMMGQGSVPPAACAVALACLGPDIARFLPNLQEWLGRLGDSRLREAILSTLELDPPVLRGPAGAREEEQVPVEWRFTLEKYKCLVRGLRCWQMEGSVYRGIMTDLPRVVAAVWLEKELQTEGAPDSYTNRFATPRSIFEERLETMIDDDTRMQFGSFTPPFQVNGAIPPGWDSSWQDDVIITNRGILFPEVKPLYTGAVNYGYANATEALVGMLGEIRAGRAGNPVFTDSMRTM